MERMRGGRRKGRQEGRREGWRVRERRGKKRWGGRMGKRGRDGLFFHEHIYLINISSVTFYYSGIVVLNLSFNRRERNINNLNIIIKVKYNQ